jgi:hypothetical protein
VVVKLDASEDCGWRNAKQRISTRPLRLPSCLWRYDVEATTMTGTHDDANKKLLDRQDTMNDLYMDWI